MRYTYRVRIVNLNTGEESITHSVFGSLASANRFCYDWMLAVPDTKAFPIPML